MTPTDPSTWMEKTVVLHRSGRVAVLSDMGTSAHGWWSEDGRYLSVHEMNSGDWIALTPELVALLFNQDGAG